MILKNQGGFTRHAGVLLSLIILLILLVWNWNTCFTPGGESIYTRITNWIMGPTKSISKEGFAGDDTKALAAGIDDTKLELKVRPEDKAVDVKFKGVNAGNTLSANSKVKVKGYLLVLAKYDKDLKQVGALNVKISDEGGSTFKEQLEAFTDKYKGMLDSGIILKIKLLKYCSTYSDVISVFTDSIITTNNQMTDIFFALMDLLYTYKRNHAITLSKIYTELAAKTPGETSGETSAKLPTLTTGTPPSSGTNGVDYLLLSSKTGIDYKDKLAKEDAGLLKRALTDYKSVRDHLALTNSPYYMTKLRDLMDRIVDLYSNPPVTSTNKMCDDDGLCKYTFTELEPVDPQGAPYNYKLGVGVVIVGSDGNDKVSKIDAYTYGGPKRLEFFKLTNTLEEQAKLVRRLDMVDRNQLAAAAAAPTPTQALPGAPGSASGDMDAYMKMLRPYLGDYPYEFQMSKAQMDDVSLSKYLQESLALGQVNVNIGISDLAGATTPTATAAAGTVDFN